MTIHIQHKDDKAQIAIHSLVHYCDYQGVVHGFRDTSERQGWTHVRVTVSFDCLTAIEMFAYSVYNICSLTIILCIHRSFPVLNADSLSLLTRFHMLTDISVQHTMLIEGALLTPLQTPTLPASQQSPGANYVFRALSLILK
jgi:hypothetical protein